MRTRKEMKQELSMMTYDELCRYEMILNRNKEMGVTHLESMDVNDIQLVLVDELIRKQFNPAWDLRR